MAESLLNQNNQFKQRTAPKAIPDTDTAEVKFLRFLLERQLPVILLKIYDQNWIYPELLVQLRINCVSGGYRNQLW